MKQKLPYLILFLLGLIVNMQGVFAAPPVGCTQTTGTNNTLIWTCNNFVGEVTMTCGTTQSIKLIVNGVTDTLSCDLNPPTVTWSPINPVLINTNQVFTATCEDDLSGCEKATYTCTVNSNNGTCSVAVKDLAGNSKSYISPVAKIDKTVPTVTWSPNPVTWNNSGSQLFTATCSDNLAGCEKATYTCTTNLNNGTCSVTAKDKVGNSLVYNSPLAKIDTIAPAAIWSPATPVWQITDQVFIANCNDVISGCVNPSTTCAVKTNEGVCNIVFKDNAGNSTTLTSPKAKIDSQAAKVGLSCIGLDNINNASSSVVCTATAESFPMKSHAIDKISITHVTQDGILPNPGISQGTETTSPLQVARTYTNNGTYTVMAKVQDQAGNEASALPITFTIDTSNPAINSDWKDDIWYSTPNIPDLIIRVRDQQNTTNSEETGISSVNYKIDGGFLQGVNLQTNGTEEKVFQINLKNLKDGIHTVNINVSDKVGHTSSVTYKVQVDLTKPTCGEVTYTPATWTNKNVITNITCSDVQSGCVQPSFSEIYTTNTVSQITIQDNVGNTNTCPIEVKNIDLIKPIVVDLKINPNQWTQGSVKISGNFTDSESGPWGYYYRCAADDTWLWKYSTGVIDFDCSVESRNLANVIVYDVAYNVVGKGIAYKIDKTPGVVDLMCPGLTNQNKSDGMVTCTAKGASLPVFDLATGVSRHAPDSLNLSHQTADGLLPSDGQTFGTEIDSPVEIIRSYTNNGTYTIAASLTDVAGNITEAQPITFMIDTTNPAINSTWNESNWYNKTTLPLMSVTIQDQQQTTQVEETGINLIRYKFNNNDWINTGYKTVGVTPVNFSIDLKTLSNGVQTVTIEATDNVGHITTVDYKVQIDLTKPVCGQVTYAPSGWTNGTVTAIVACSDSNQSGCTQSEYSKNYTQNGDYQIGIVDNVGNTNSCAVKVDKIDKIKPDCNTGAWSPDPVVWKTGSQIFALSGVTDNGTIKTAGGNCTVNVNQGTCSVTVDDQAGNTNNCISPQAKIDNTAPTLSASEVDYSSPSNPKLVISASDPESGVQGGKYAWNTTVDCTNALTSPFNSLTLASLNATPGWGGPYTLNICVKNGAGTITNLTKVYHIDGTPPTCTLTKDGGSVITNTNPLEIGDTIKIKCKDNESGCVTAESSKTLNDVAALENFLTNLPKIKDVAGNETICGAPIASYLEIRGLSQSSSMAGLRTEITNLIKQNVADLTRGLTSSTSNSSLPDWKNNIAYYKKNITLGAFTVDAKKTIIVENGNLILNGNITISNGGILGIIVLGGDVTIGANVGTLNAVLFTDGEVLSADKTSNQQLYWKGSVISNSTIDELSTFRVTGGTPLTDPLGHLAPFIIEYDPVVQTNPPLGFESSGGVNFNEVVR